MANGEMHLQITKIAIMQPYFLPYIGYFQLMREVDIFVVYDNIKYTKKGWINRNRMLSNGDPQIFSLPLKNAADHLNVRDRDISVEFSPQKLLTKIQGKYYRAPCFETTYSLLNDIFLFPSRNLFEYLFHSIDLIRKHLCLNTLLVPSSSLDIDLSLRGQDRVLAICRALGTSQYVNPPGGKDLYDSGAFRAEGMTLSFLEPALTPYAQFGGVFVPALSILDVLMFNPVERILEELLPAYDVVAAET